MGWYYLTKLIKQLTGLMIAHLPESIKVDYILLFFSRNTISSIFLSFDYETIAVKMGGSSGCCGAKGIVSISSSDGIGL